MLGPAQLRNDWTVGLEQRCLALPQPAPELRETFVVAVLGTQPQCWRVSARFYTACLRVAKLLHRSVGSTVRRSADGPPREIDDDLVGANSSHGDSRLLADIPDDEHLGVSEQSLDALA